MSYLTGETRAQLDAFKAVIVKHARLQEADATLQLSIEEHADSTHVLLCGPGGVGKSTVLKGITERFTSEEANGTVVPIVLLEPIPSQALVRSQVKAVLIDEGHRNHSISGAGKPVIPYPGTNRP